MQLADIASLRVTVMGLGLHGGGLATALFFARRGARVTVTDNRSDREVFADTLPLLREAGIRTVLGRHEQEDFTGTDLVVKNPAVSPSSPYLQAARDAGIPVETDLSVFLDLCSNPLIGVTGSKGKSTTASAIHFCLLDRYPNTKLGGNITVSPLSFLEEIRSGDPIVLELSSWQLADVRGKDLLAPQISVLTVILPDHQDRYPGMKEYIEDKKVIFQSQGPDQYAVFNREDPQQQGFEEETRAEIRYFSSSVLPPSTWGAFLQPDGALIRDLESDLALSFDPPSIPGQHNRLNLLAAGLACHCFGLDPDTISSRLQSFPGIEHRLEFVSKIEGVRYFNDSAATIPEATAAALNALEAPIVLLAGGTDKHLDFRPLLDSIALAETVVLLQGSATEKMQALFEENGVGYKGPFSTLQEALLEARRSARPGASIVFSPACASFELFLNEFDRGKKFKELVQKLRG
jgi:UDP-N-acetylmuramoylalanine--D-glutamate ligase